MGSVNPSVRLTSNDEASAVWGTRARNRLRLRTLRQVEEGGGIIPVVLDDGAIMGESHTHTWSGVA